MTTNAERKMNVKVIEATVLATSSYELPAKPKRGKQAAVPARTMGIIGIVTSDGEYIEVTDFSKQWQSIEMDKRARLIVDVQDRQRDGRQVRYYNLKRAVSLTPGNVPTEVSELAEA